MPKEFQPRREFSSDSNYHLQHLLRLHFAYHSCYANLYKIYMLSGTTADQASGQEALPLKSDTSQTMAEALESARSAIELLKLVPLLGDTYVW